MDPAQTSDHHDSHHASPQVHAPAPTVAAPTAKGMSWLNRTSGAFVAEYCMFIIALGIAIASLNWLIYMFFGLVVAAMTHINLGGSSLKLLILWLAIASLVSLPIAAILWSRTKGELLANEHFKGVLPGGARGFRTFWIVLTVIGMIGMLIMSIYAPLAALVGGSEGAGELVVGVTIPGFINLGLSVAGIYLMTRPAHALGISRVLLWAVAGLSTLLFVVNFAWVASMPDPYSPYRSTPQNDPYYYSY